MRPRRSTAALVLALAGLTAGGCASSSPDNNAATGGSTSGTRGQPAATTSSPSGAPSPSTRSSETTAVSPAATTSSPTASAVTSATASAEPDSSPARAVQAQIPAGQLPGFNAQWHWDQVGRLRDLVSPCLRSPLVSIGAVNQVGRTFHSTAGAATDEAAQLTGVFPDEHTALTAAAVLTAWHGRCAKNAAADGRQHVAVSQLRDVATPVGTGRQWMLTYRPVAGQPDSTWFVSQGFVRDGDTITVVVYRNAGQDYDYPVGSEPIDRALAVAGHYLQRSR